MRLNSEEKINKKNRNSISGITLISLVITIIVLIILCGISINLLLGNNGIIIKAKETSKINKKESIIEEIRLKLLAQQTEGINISKSNLKTMLSIYGTIKEENGEIISVILEDGTIIEIKEIYSEKIIEDNITYIYNKTQLETFRDNVNNGKTYENEVVMLMNDIDLQGNNKNSSTYWIPIGIKNVIAFNGEFNGNNHKIDNMYMYKKSNEGEEIALFSNINNATIKNITVNGKIEIEGENIAAGGIVGRASGKIVIENCINNVNIISECTSRGIGGIITNLSNEENSELLIKNCTNLGNMVAKENGSGILGYTTRH